MIANIPLSLTECLSPKELEELLEVSEADHSTPEDTIVHAVRDFLSARRDPQMPLRFGDTRKPKMNGGRP